MDRISSKTVCEIIKRSAPVYSNVDFISFNNWYRLIEGGAPVLGIIAQPEDDDGYYLDFLDASEEGPTKLVYVPSKGERHTLEHEKFYLYTHGILGSEYIGEFKPEQMTAGIEEFKRRVATMRRTAYKIIEFLAATERDGKKDRKMREKEYSKIPDISMLTEIAAELFTTQ